jgi:hypothetical protein
MYVSSGGPGSILNQGDLWETEHDGARRLPVRRNVAPVNLGHRAFFIRSKSVFNDVIASSGEEALMAARKTRDRVSARVELNDVPAAPTTSLRLAEQHDPSISSGAHALLVQIQSHIDAEDGAQRRSSPARGIAFALIPSALVWWGVIAGVRALIQHGH